MLPSKSMNRTGIGGHLFDEDREMWLFKLVDLTL